MRSTGWEWMRSTAAGISSVMARRDRAHGGTGVRDRAARRRWVAIGALRVLYPDVTPEEAADVVIAPRRTIKSGGRSALGGGEPHKARAFFVVELQAQGADPIPQGQRWGLVEDGVLVVGAL